MGTRRASRLSHSPATNPLYWQRHAPVTHPIFSEPTGRRWLLTKISCALVVALVAVVGWLAWLPTHTPQGYPQGVVITMPPMGTAKEPQIPDFGSGPLVRVVHIVSVSHVLSAVDPVTKQNYGPVTLDDLSTIGNVPYALQHYGYSSVVHKTIELTFDDGPNPIWTPKILNVLSKYHVPATFFVIGEEAVQFPSIVKREVREGHTVGNHSLTHPNIRWTQVASQFGQTDRILTSITGERTNLVRLPYDGNTGPQGSGDVAQVMVACEEMGYIVSLDEFDTNDWMYGDRALRPKRPIPLPPMSADNLTMLLHDGGGDRSATVAYLERLIPWALHHGYHFYSLAQVSPEVVAGEHQVTPTLNDQIDFYFYSAIWSWPNILIGLLFLFAVLSVIVGGMGNVLLALIRHVWYRRRLAALCEVSTGPPASVIIAAYNEERVIGRTIAAIQSSQYANIREIIVVDDGSRDTTAKIVRTLAEHDTRIRLLRQRNGGKPSALNYAVRRARSPILVTLDADTIFTPTTVGNLVRHFALDPSGTLGAVAGTIKVGNRRNLLTRWQALEYIIQIGIDRGAQDLIRGIVVVPGACAAWRRNAVLRAGGYSHVTLAEDCDLCLHLQRLGYRVVQDDHAVSFTEAPETIGMLVRQRFRWMYGNLQALWKQRAMMFNPRFGWLGLWSLPFAAISALMPIVFLPFVDLMIVVNLISNRWFDVVIYAVIFLVVQFVSAAIGIWLTGEQPSHLVMVPLYRLIYEPLRAYLIYKCVLTALRGASPGWNKVVRLGTVTPVPRTADERRAMAGSSA